MAIIVFCLYIFYYDVVMFVIRAQKVCLNVELLHSTISFVSLMLYVVKTREVCIILFSLSERDQQSLIIACQCRSSCAFLTHSISSVVFHFRNLFKCSSDWASDEIHCHSFLFVDSYIYTQPALFCTSDNPELPHMFPVFPVIILSSDVNC